MYEYLVKELHKYNRQNKPSVTCMIDAKIDERLEKIIRRLNKITESLSLISLIRPTNLRTIEKFWKEEGPESSAIPFEFQYNKKGLMEATEKAGEIELLRQELKSINLGNGQGAVDYVLREIVGHRIKDVLKNAEIAKTFLEGSDTEKSNSIAKKYPRPEDWLLVEANQTIKWLLDESKAGRRFDSMLLHVQIRANELRDYFADVLAKYGMDDWKVELSDSRKIISVRYDCPDGIPRIYIPSNRIVNGVEAIRLATHEIECHVLDTMNGMALTHGLCKVDNDFLYEGRASFSDVMVESRYTGIPKTLLCKAILVIGIDMAINGANFCDVAKMAYQKFVEFCFNRESAMNEAFKIALRIFRGCSESANRNNSGYAFTKDTVYLRGYMKAYELSQAGLSNYLLLGMSTPEDLIAVSGNFSVTDLSGLPYKNCGFSEKLARNL